jgi:hypothetical protein
MNCIQALNRYGFNKMAEDFFQSGNTRLVEAGRKWAQKQGYRLQPTKETGMLWGKGRGSSKD